MADEASAYLINSLAEIVDEAALAEALDRADTRSSLDVFEREPKVDQNLKQRNAVLFPHLGSSTIEARTGTGEKVIANIEAFIAGRAPDRCATKT